MPAPVAGIFLGLMVIVPMWLLAYIFRPPGARSD
jgi:hypothetical protein